MRALPAAGVLALMMCATFCLVPVDEDQLTDDPYPDLPVQLLVRGRYSVPVEGAAIAEIEVRCNQAQLAHLLTQGRATQAHFAQRARRDAELAGVKAEATRLVTGYVASDDVETLRRVVAGLRGLPDEAPS